MENNLFEDMPEAPTPPWDLGLPRYFPRGLTPGAGWYQNEFLPWIQNQNPKKLVGYWNSFLQVNWLEF